MDLADLSKLERVLKLGGPEVKARVRKALGGREPSWLISRRPKQVLPPGDWRYWLVLAGRGFGKTRTGAEAIAQWYEEGFRYFSAAGRTTSDVREVMVEGQSGLLPVLERHEIPVRYKASRRVILIDTVKMGVRMAGVGSIRLYSADKPDAFRGPQFEKSWADELAAWRYVKDAFSNLKLGLRLGRNPQAVITTTPRPIPTLRQLLEKGGRTFVTRGSTFENRANLAREWFDEIVSEFVGTSLGDQELYAAMLDDAPGALWKRGQLEALRVQEKPINIRRTVVAIDPAVSTKEGAAETGIVVVCVADCSCKGSTKIEPHLFVLEDATGSRPSPTTAIHKRPNEWALAAVKAYRANRADVIVGEVNNGGEMIENTIRSLDDPEAKTLRYLAVRASEGKRTRAEPIGALYEQGRVHHVGSFPELEDQQCTWEPLRTGDRSPDRVDALVWGCTELLPYVRAGSSRPTVDFSIGDKRRM